LKRRLVLYVSPDFACFQTTYEELKQYEVETFLKKIEAGFQTTYEELKPFISSAFRGTTDRFQTTYEELKHMYEMIDSVGLPRFQTTYEELKLFPPHIPIARTLLPDYL